MILAENQNFDDGAYRIDSFIARGGMAEVWRVERTDGHKICALKILTRKSMAHDDVVERFKLEYQMLQKLNHPNIVSVLDFGWYTLKDVKLPWYTMEYFPFNLRQRLPQVSIGEGIRLLLPVLDALDFAHSKKICHRDLKPINILVDSEGRAALTDFGIAKEMDKNRNLTGRNIIGTATYISPEQCLGVPVVPASDVYSMGVILYQLCTGRFPFEDPSEITVIQKHIKEMPSDVRSINSAISDDLAEAVMRCLEKKPEARYQTARELRVDLMRCPELQESVERILKPGELILENKYRVVGLIEQGGFAEVYRVKDIKSGRPYALKILMPALTYDAETLKRFEREIKILKSLDHPHIVKAIDSGHYNYKTLSLPFFVMRYYAGNLQASMNDPIDKDRAIAIVIDVLEALDHSHSMEGGIFHRDLKPSNILISSDGHGFLTDFGIAKVSKSLSSIVTRSATMTRAAVGTSIYMAPEQIRNDPVTGQTDIYSIGVILYEIAADKRPFDAKSSEQITAMHLYVEPESPRVHNPKILPKFEAIILKCLAKDPAKRFANVGELVQALTEAKHQGSWFGDEPVGRFSAKEITKNLARTFSSPAPYLAAAAAAAMFFLDVGGAVAYRGMKLPLPEGASRMNLGYYPLKHVSAIVEREKNVEKALEQLGSASAVQIAAKPAITVPPEFLKPDDHPLFDAMTKARDDAAAKQDVALARRLDARMIALLQDAEKPDLRVNDATPKIKSTNRQSEDFTVSFVSTAMREDLRKKFKYDYKISTVKDGKPAQLQGAGAKLNWDEATGQAKLEIAGLPPGKYEAELVGRFDSSIPGVSYERKVDHDFDITFQNVPVNVAVAEQGRKWKLTANTDPKNALVSWDWKLKNMQTGQFVPAPPASKNGELAIDDSFYETLPQGRYSVVCEASTRENLKASSDEGSNSFVVDLEPPKLEIAGGVNQLTILPSDARVSVNLQAKDNLADPATLVIHEEKGSVLNGGVRQVAWNSPGTKEAFGKATLTFYAEDPNAREKWRRSAPVTLSVYSIGQSTEDLLASWRDQEGQIKAGGERYARTNKLAPIGADVADAAQNNAINRQWLEAAIAEPSRLDTLRKLLDARKGLKASDDQFQARADAFRTIVSAGPTTHRDEVEAAIREIGTAWVSAPATETPKEILKPAEAKLLPPVPAGSVLSQPNAQNPEQSEIRVTKDFVTQFGPNAQYRYVFTSEDPSAKNAAQLNQMLAEQERVDTSPRDRPVGEDLTKPRYLVIQTVLADAGTGESFYSPPAVHPVPPLVNLDPAAKQQLETYADLLKQIREAKSGTYQRTIAFIDKQNFPFIDSGTRRPDVMWLIRNSQKPEEVQKLQDGKTILEQYRAGDQKFEEVATGLIKSKTEAWTSDHKSEVTDRVKRSWLTAAVDTDPATFVGAQIDGYMKAATTKAPLLASPKLDGKYRWPDDDKKLRSALETAKNLEGVFLAWGTGEKDPDAAAAWSAKDASGKADLREPPDHKRPYNLAMRFQVEEDGVPLHSAWTRIGNFSPLTPTPGPTAMATPKPTATPMPATPTPAISMKTPTPAATPMATEKPTPAPSGDLTLAEAQSWAQSKVGASLPSSGSRGRGADEMLAKYLDLFAPGADRKKSQAVTYFNDDRTGKRQKMDIDDGRTSFTGADVKSAGEGKYLLIWDARLASGSKITWSAVVTLKKIDGQIYIEKEESFKRGSGQ